MYDRQGATYLFDLDYVEDVYTVDAAHYGNISHFVNHSVSPLGEELPPWGSGWGLEGEGLAGALPTGGNTCPWAHEWEGPHQRGGASSSTAHWGTSLLLIVGGGTAWPA